MFYHFKGTSRFFLCKRNVRYYFPWDLRTERKWSQCLELPELGAAECGMWPVPTFESQFCTSLSNSKFSGMTWVA